ncbi:copper chaperone PCu(A)C [Geodermatophilus sp. SYSU D01180]
MNRALRAAVMGALVLSPVALGACSAGQVSQTGTQDRDKVGPQAQVEDILLRQVLIAYPENERYEEGDDAELILTIVNASNEDDTLTGIEGEGFDGVVVSASGTSAVPAPTVPGATPTASSRVSLDVPADSALYIGREDGATVTLQDLGEELTAGQTLTLTLTFEQAGEITTQALVAGPDEEIERGESFDFEEGLEEENPESEEDTQAE